MDIYKHIIYNPNIQSIASVIENVEAGRIHGIEIKDEHRGEWKFENVQHVSEYECVAIFSRWDSWSEEAIDIKKAPEEKHDAPVMGPRITWHLHTAIDMIKLHGREGAIERLAGDKFTHEYVRKMLEILVPEDKEQTSESKSPTMDEMCIRIGKDLPTQWCITSIHSMKDIVLYPYAGAPDELRYTIPHIVWRDGLTDSEVSTEIQKAINFVASHSQKQ